MYSVIGKRAKSVKRKVCHVSEKFYQHHEMREKRMKSLEENKRNFG